MKRKYNYKKIMKGKRWEYPLPCMRNYWKKIISEERRKLLADLEEKDVEEEEKVEIESFDSLEVNPPTLKDDEPPDEEKPPLERRYNPYALFLIKPRRKVRYRIDSDRVIF